MNFAPYLISPDDYVLIEIMRDNTFIVSSREYGGEKWGEGNVMKVSFTVREAGTYKISVLAQGRPIKGSPFTKTFLPGASSFTLVILLDCHFLASVCRFSSSRFFSKM